MKLRVSGPARRDILAILAWSGERFGENARERYEQLIASALRSITSDAEPIGTKRHPDLSADLRLLHLRYISQVGGDPIVRKPRHLIAFRKAGPDLIVVVRVLHDAMDLPARLI